MPYEATIYRPRVTTYFVTKSYSVNTKDYFNEIYFTDTKYILFKDL